MNPKLASIVMLSAMFGGLCDPSPIPSPPLDERWTRTERRTLSDADREAMESADEKRRRKGARREREKALREAGGPLMFTPAAYVLFFIAWALLCTAAQVDALTWRTVRRTVTRGVWSVVDAVQSVREFGRWCST